MPTVEIVRAAIEILSAAGWSGTFASEGPLDSLFTAGAFLSQMLVRNWIYDWKIFGKIHLHNIYVSTSPSGGRKKKSIYVCIFFMLLLLYVNTTFTHMYGLQCVPI